MYMYLSLKMNLIGADFVFLWHIFIWYWLQGSLSMPSTVYLIKSKFMNCNLRKVVSFDSQIINDDINTTCTWINTIWMKNRIML